MVRLLSRAKLEELPQARHMMGCEFESTETHVGNDKQTHVRTICLGNMLDCLVDTPMGYAGCTRRTWLMLKEPALDVKAIPQTRKRRKVSDLQGQLV